MTKFDDLDKRAFAALDADFEISDEVAVIAGRMEVEIVRALPVMASINSGCGSNFPESSRASLTRNSAEVIDDPIPVPRTGP